MELAGVLPAPASRQNRGAADLLEGQLFAYGVGSAVGIVEVGGCQWLSAICGLMLPRRCSVWNLPVDHKLTT